METSVRRHRVCERDVCVVYIYIFFPAWSRSATRQLFSALSWGPVGDDRLVTNGLLSQLSAPHMRGKSLTQRYSRLKRVFKDAKLSFCFNFSSPGLNFKFKNLCCARNEFLYNQNILCRNKQIPLCYKYFFGILMVVHSVMSALCEADLVSNSSLTNRATRPQMKDWQQINGLFCLDNR